MPRKNFAAKTVFVGLSGGVDSAVSAALLKKAGYEVVGVFIKTWHPEFLPCNEEEERRDAMRVAAHLDIPFLTFDLEEVYKREVAEYMIGEYRTGRTPNPDVMCNKEVKFGAFLERALALGADYIATGHYARVEKTKIKNLKLKIALDPAKDQSYFLWALTQKELKRVMFPIGGLRKTEVRTLAKKFKLPVAEKKDSQGICFLGPVDLKDFLKHYIKEKRGEVILAPSEAEGQKDKVIGYHDGAVFHTLGERHGFTITAKTPRDLPYYIVGKDVKKNILIVSQSKNLPRESTRIRLLTNRSRLGSSASVASPEAGFCVGLKDTNWISEIPKSDKNYTAQIRYHGELLSCKVKCSTPSVAQAVFDKPVLAASGQSAVIYDGTICLGGGVIV